MERDINLLKSVKEKHRNLVFLSNRRRRCMEFAYGNQWDDNVYTSEGRRISEGEWMRRTGRVPITNNLIRRVLKGVAGYWEQQSGRGKNDPLKRLDASSLEELLISGIAVQRVARRNDLFAETLAVCPDDFFCSSLKALNNSELIGAYHTLPKGGVLMYFSSGNPATALRINEVLTEENGDAESSDNECRLIEVWHKQSLPAISWHDPLHGGCYQTGCTSGHLNDLERLNECRRRDKRPEVNSRFCMSEEWQQTWMTESGVVLNRKMYKDLNAVPYIAVSYPRLDGRVRSVVSDLIEQQKYINRLVSTLDSVITYSAKGVLLYPSDQLPRGLTWKDIRRMWDNPGGVLPFSPTRKGLAPMQINSSGRLDGAMQMLQLQMKLFDDMAGIEGANSPTMQGVTGSEMLKTKIEQNRIMLRDVLTAFEELIRLRKQKE